MERKNESCAWASFPPHRGIMADQSVSRGFSEICKVVRRKTRNVCICCEFTTDRCKNIPARFREWLTEILLHCAHLGWGAEHLESESQNLAQMF